MKAIEIIRRDIQQYGIGLNKFYPRSQNNLPRILVNSIPKAGTNLLMRALYLYPNLHRKFQRTLYTCSLEDLSKNLERIQGGKLVPAHLHYDVGYRDILDIMGFKRFLMIRDPRDIALSNFYYITYKDKHHPLHHYFNSKLKNDSERLLISIEGKNVSAPYVPSLDYILDKYIGWLGDPKTLIVPFEKIVGEDGCGSEVDQENIIRDIYAHLEIMVSDLEVKKIAKSLFSNSSRTFHKGQVGRWREVFKDEHVEAFKRVCGEKIIRLGYEKDNNWQI